MSMPSAGKRLNIGLVVPGFSADETDWCIPALLNLVRRLAVEHDVTVYTLRYPHAARSYTVAGARVRAFGGATVGAGKRLALLWRAIGAIVADAARKPYSLLHGLWADEAGLVAVLAGRRLRIPALVSIMGGELARLPEIDYGVQLRTVGRLLTTISLRLADIVSAGSQQLLESAGHQVPGYRLRLLPLGVDLSMFYPAGTAASPPFRIMHAASLTAVKDQDTLLTAFSSVVASLAPVEATLVIAGDGPLRATLMARAQTLGISDRVQWLGAVAHEQMPAFYRGGHLFVLSSRHESQSMASLESAACGLPLVGTAVGLLPQLLPAAHLAPVGDASLLARCMMRLLGDEEKRRREARRLQGVVHSHYGLEARAGRLIETYQDLVCRHAK